MAELQKCCADTALQVSTQQALRLLFGCDLSVKAAKGRADEVQVWRSEHSMAKERQRLQAYLSGGAGGPVPKSMRLPHHAEVCKLMVVNPCVLTTADGRPVSIWHIGSAHGPAVSTIPDAVLAAWSRSTFEYVDVWLSAQSETSGRLAGHVQVFDLAGLGFFQVTNAALIEKLKLALGAGGMYVEVVSRIYVINSGSLFSTAWKVIKTLITPRTASKVSVTNDVPQELRAELDDRSRARLPGLLRRPQPDAPVLLPPCSLGR